MIKRQRFGLWILIFTTCLICSAQNVEIKPLFHLLFQDHQVAFIGYGISDWMALQPFNADIQINQTSLQNIKISSFKESNLPINLVFALGGSQDFILENQLWISELILQFASDPLSKDQKRLRIGILNNDKDLQFFLPENQSALITALDQLDFTGSGQNLDIILKNALETIEKNENFLSGINQIVLISDGTTYQESSLQQEEIEQRIASTGTMIHLLDMGMTNSRNANSKEPDRFPEFISSTGGLVSTVEELNQTAAFKDRLLNTINKKLIIQGTIPDTLIPQNSNQILLSLSLEKDQSIIARMAQTVRLPSEFSQSTNPITNKTEPFVAATLVPILNDDTDGITTHNDGSNSAASVNATLVPVFQSSSLRPSSTIPKIPIQTNTIEPSQKPTVKLLFSHTAVASATHTASVTALILPTATPTQTLQPASNATVTLQSSPTAVASATYTVSFTASVFPTATPTQTLQPASNATVTLQSSPTAIASAARTASVTALVLPTATPTQTLQPASTATVTLQSSPTAVASATRTASFTATELPTAIPANTSKPSFFMPSSIFPTENPSETEVISLEEKQQDVTESDHQMLCFKGQCVRIPPFFNGPKIHKISEYLENNLFEVTLMLYTVLVVFLILFTSGKIMHHIIRRKKLETNEKEEKKNQK